MRMIMMHLSIRSYFLILCVVVACLTLYHLGSLNRHIGHPESPWRQPDISVYMYVNELQNNVLIKNKTASKNGKVVIVLEIQSDIKDSQNKIGPSASESKTNINHTKVSSEARKETIVNMTTNIGKATDLSIEINTTETIKTFPLTTGDRPYRINNRQICQGAKDILFVVLVHTATEHFQRRQSIRETWANVSLYQNVHIRIVFLLGLTKKEEVQTKIEEENKIHGDLVQGIFLDTYHNLTHKGVMGLRWVTENCRQARFVVKVDDDVFVDTLKLIGNVLAKNINASRQILGRVDKKNTSKIMRSGKWKVEENEFFNLTRYPFSFCKGFIVILTNDIIEQLYETSKITPFFWIDDVYLFGILPDRVANITHVPLNGLNLNEKKGLECFNATETNCPLLVGNAHTNVVMHKLWQGAIRQNKDLAMTYLKLNTSNELNLNIINTELQRQTD